jgi:hypothetical protein
VGAAHTTDWQSVGSTGWWRAVGSSFKAAQAVAGWVVAVLAVPHWLACRDQGGSRMCTDGASIGALRGRGTSGSEQDGGGGQQGGMVAWHNGSSAAVQQCTSSAHQCSKAPAAVPQRCSAALWQQCRSAAVPQCRSAAVHQQSAPEQQCRSAAVPQCTSRAHQNSSAAAQQYRSATAQHGSKAAAHLLAQQRSSAAVPQDGRAAGYQHSLAALQPCSLATGQQRSRTLTTPLPTWCLISCLGRPALRYSLLDQPTVPFQHGVLIWLRLLPVLKASRSEGAVLY